VATDLEQLAYDLSLRSLSQQEGLLNEVRARTGVLLAATAIAISLLGGRALDDGERTVLNLAGVALGVLSFLLSVYVLAPKDSSRLVPKEPRLTNTLSPRGQASERRSGCSRTGTARSGRGIRR
jgi:uncharacterized membrane protein YfcA